MNAPVPTATVDGPARRRTRLRPAARVAAWVLGVPAALAILLYLVLLVTPLPLPFANNAARALAMAVMPPSSDLELGDMALALEGGVVPVIRFSPVVLSDRRSGARIGMEALEVGFSPARALIGQPGATVTVVGPDIQIVQDLFGPRATRFELVEDPSGGPATVRVLEGLDAFPAVGILPEGIAFDGRVAGDGQMLRSDNDWLIFNLEAAEAGLADVVEQAMMGRFSRLVVRQGSIGMTDSVYGLFRRFEEVALDISPSADGRNIAGTFSARVGGRTMTGTVSRTLNEDGTATLEADITNIDFASFVPFIDDPDSIAAMRGAGAVSIDVDFDVASGAVQGGEFKIDLTGLDLRIKDDFFPVASSILDVDWEPETGRFTLSEGAIRVGRSSGYVKGVFALGLDEAYGPTIAMSMTARDVAIHPEDMDPPEAPFETMEFAGWSAPLYGAMGIDRWAARRGDAAIETTGRIDLLRAGVGLDMTVSGQGITADDLKRLWPYVMGGSSRDWFVANITEGTVARSNMRFRFPIGSIALGEESGDRPMPKDSMQVEIVGTGVAIRPTEDMAPIAIDGEMVLRLNDSDLSIAAAGGVVPTGAGPITVSSPALVMETPPGGQALVEISGDIEAGIPALIALIREQQPEALEGAEMPIDIETLTGSIDVGVLATIRLADEAAGLPMQLDYVLNGAVTDFASSAPIQGRRIGNGQLAFSASQAGYQVGGTAEIDGLPAEIEIEGEPEGEPEFRLASTIRAADLAAMGFDASDFLSGQVRFVAQPMADGSMQVAIDLAEAGLTITDLGISKVPGVPGTLRASIRQEGEVTRLGDIALAFGDVRLEGGLAFHAENGLQSAEFSRLQLSPGDEARVALAPMPGGGYAVTMRGRQLDLKPMLRRFFGLGEGSGGVQATQFDQTLALDIALDRVIGVYGTTAFNVDLDLVLAGSDLRRANVSATFTEGNALSITTNATPEGRIMSMAFNDAGTILRLLGIYSQLAGGSGSLVLNRNASQNVEAGELVLHNFSIVEEANVAQILGNHPNSRTLIAERNRLDFDSARVGFVRRPDRIEVTEGLLSGDLVGGTMRGFIYTDQRQYDLTGTYVPIFGLNNAFQQIPLFGPLLGGRDGEGLVGVTFAVRGPLDKPEFRVNPLSALVPGMFRELFEFRTRGQPQ